MEAAVPGWLDAGRRESYGLCVPVALSAGPPLIEVGPQLRLPFGRVQPLTCPPTQVGCFGIELFVVSLPCGNVAWPPPRHGI